MILDHAAPIFDAQIEIFSNSLNLRMSGAGLKLLEALKINAETRGLKAFHRKVVGSQPSCQYLM